MALGRTARYYRKNKKARAKHRAYQSKYNKKKKSIKQRVADNRANRRFGTYGNYDGLDVSRKGKGKYVLESEKKKLRDSLKDIKSKVTEERTLKRLKLVESFIESKNKPENPKPALLITISTLIFLFFISL